MGSGSRGTARQTGQRGAISDPVILELRFRPRDAVVNSGAGESGREDIEAADLARRLNASIYKAGQLLSDEDDELELSFFCACGCMTEVKRSLREYVTRGAVVDGHRRPAGTTDSRSGG